ncbi:hypothetical protein [Dyadobacter sp. Leaf189]|uniref:hypothetical protein n=1 Tax=Dyadobacter sp. Leaf189 TaxID=1736295 RepID=UPI0006FD87D5|nr:hypothetical protein [Dyadobacter sp. Leaf189]KQS33588.1 hypothetical protein ASG33_05860 [Dyadobacter sp. Leaf189]
MITSVFRVILAGILGGFLLFLIPFLIFKALLFFLVFGLIFRLAVGRRHFGRWRGRRSAAQFYDHYEIYEGKESLRDLSNNYPKQI